MCDIIDNLLCFHTIACFIERRREDCNCSLTRNDGKDPTADTTREISGGLLWIVFAFAGAMILNRSFARELPNDCLDALIASRSASLRRDNSSSRSSSPGASATTRRNASVVTQKPSGT